MSRTGGLIALRWRQIPAQGKLRVHASRCSFRELTHLIMRVVCQESLELSLSKYSAWRWYN